MADFYDPEIPTEDQAAGITAMALKPEGALGGGTDRPKFVHAFGTKKLLKMDDKPIKFQIPRKKLPLVQYSDDESDNAPSGQSTPVVKNRNDKLKGDSGPKASGGLPVQKLAVIAEQEGALVKLAMYDSDSSSEINAAQSSTRSKTESLAGTAKAKATSKSRWSESLKSSASPTKDSKLRLSPLPEESNEQPRSSKCQEPEKSVQDIAESIRKCETLSSSKQVKVLPSRTSSKREHESLERDQKPNRASESQRQSKGRHGQKLSPILSPRKDLDENRRHGTSRGPSAGMSPLPKHSRHSPSHESHHDASFHQETYRTRVSKPQHTVSPSPNCDEMRAQQEISSPRKKLRKSSSSARPSQTALPLAEFERQSHQHSRSPIEHESRHGAGSSGSSRDYSRRSVQPHSGQKFSQTSSDWVSNSNLDDSSLHDNSYQARPSRSSRQSHGDSSFFEKRRTRDRYESQYSPEFAFPEKKHYGDICSGDGDSRAYPVSSQERRLSASFDSYGYRKESVDEYEGRSMKHSSSRDESFSYVSPEQKYRREKGYDAQSTEHVRPYEAELHRRDSRDRLWASSHADSDARLHEEFHHRIEKEQRKSKGNSAHLRSEVSEQPALDSRRNSSQHAGDEIKSWDCFGESTRKDDWESRRDKPKLKELRATELYDKRASGYEKDGRSSTVHMEGMSRDQSTMDSNSGDLSEKHKISVGRKQFVAREAQGHCAFGEKSAKEPAPKAHRASESVECSSEINSISHSKRTDESQRDIASDGNVKQLKSTAEVKATKSKKERIPSESKSSSSSSSETEDDGSSDTSSSGSDSSSSSGSDSSSSSDSASSSRSDKANEDSNVKRPNKSAVDVVRRPGKAAAVVKDVTAEPRAMEHVKKILTGDNIPGTKLAQVIVPNKEPISASSKTSLPSALAKLAESKKQKNSSDTNDSSSSATSSSDEDDSGSSSSSGESSSSSSSEESSKEAPSGSTKRSDKELAAKGRRGVEKSKDGTTSKTASELMRPSTTASEQYNKRRTTHSEKEEGVSERSTKDPALTLKSEHKARDRRRSEDEPAVGGRGVRSQSKVQTVVATQGHQSDSLSETLLKSSSTTKPDDSETKSGKNTSGSSSAQKHERGLESLLIAVAMDANKDVPIRLCQDFPEPVTDSNVQQEPSKSDGGSKHFSCDGNFGMAREVSLLSGDKTSRDVPDALNKKGAPVCPSDKGRPEAAAAGNVSVEKSSNLAASSSGKASKEIFVPMVVLKAKSAAKLKAVETAGIATSAVSRSDLVMTTACATAAGESGTVKVTAAKLSDVKEKSLRAEDGANKSTSRFVSRDPEVVDCSSKQVHGELECLPQVETLPCPAVVLSHDLQIHERKDEAPLATMLPSKKCRPDTVSELCDSSVKITKTRSDVQNSVSVPSISCAERSAKDVGYSGSEKMCADGLKTFSSSFAEGITSSCSEVRTKAAEKLEKRLPVADSRCESSLKGRRSKSRNRSNSSSGRRSRTHRSRSRLHSQRSSSIKRPGSRSKDDSDYRHRTRENVDYQDRYHRDRRKRSTSHDRSSLSRSRDHSGHYRRSPDYRYERQRDRKHDHDREQNDRDRERNDYDRERYDRDRERYDRDRERHDRDRERLDWDRERNDRDCKRWQHTPEQHSVKNSDSRSRSIEKRSNDRSRDENSRQRERYFSRPFVAPDLDKIPLPVASETDLVTAHAQTASTKTQSSHGSETLEGDRHTKSTPDRGIDHLQTSMINELGNSSDRESVDMELENDDDADASLVDSSAPDQGMSFFCPPGKSKIAGGKVTAAGGKIAFMMKESCRKSLVKTKKSVFEEDSDSLSDADSKPRKFKLGFEASPKDEASSRTPCVLVTASSSSDFKRESSRSNLPHGSVEYSDRKTKEPSSGGRSGPSKAEPIKTEVSSSSRSERRNRTEEKRKDARDGSEARNVNESRTSRSGVPLDNGSTCETNLNAATMNHSVAESGLVTYPPMSRSGHSAVSVPNHHHRHHASRAKEDSSTDSYSSRAKEDFSKDSYSSRAKEDFSAGSYSSRVKEEFTTGSYSSRAKEDFSTDSHSSRAKEDFSTGSYSSSRVKEEFSTGSYSSRVKEEVSTGSYSSRAREEVSTGSYSSRAKEDFSAGSYSSRAKEDFSTGSYSRVKEDFSTDSYVSNISVVGETVRRPWSRFDSSIAVVPGHRGHRFVGGDIGRVGIGVMISESRPSRRDARERIKVERICTVRTVTLAEEKEVSSSTVDGVNVVSWKKESGSVKNGIVQAEKNFISCFREETGTKAVAADSTKNFSHVQDIGLSSTVVSKDFSRSCSVQGSDVHQAEADDTWRSESKASVKLPRDLVMCDKSRSSDSEEGSRPSQVEPHIPDIEEKPLVTDASGQYGHEEMVSGSVCGSCLTASVRPRNDSHSGAYGCLWEALEEEEVPVLLSNASEAETALYREACVHEASQGHADSKESFEVTTTPLSETVDNLSSCTLSEKKRRRRSEQNFRTGDSEQGSGEDQQSLRRRSTRLRSKEEKKSSNEVADKGGKGKKRSSENRSKKNDDGMQNCTEEERKLSENLNARNLGGFVVNTRFDSSHMTAAEVSEMQNSQKALSSGSGNLDTSPALSADGSVSSQVKPEKVKSRWRRYSELDSNSLAPPPPPPPPPPPSDRDEFLKPISSVRGVTSLVTLVEEALQEIKTTSDESGDQGFVSDTEAFPNKQLVPEKRQEEPAVQPHFEEILDNIFLSERDTKKSRKEARRMVCDCTLPSSEDMKLDMKPCGEDCLNRMLMIECGTRCSCGDLCTNKLFQRHEYAMTRSFKTGAKGWGLQAAEDMTPGTFIMEYVGEVLDYREFKARTKKYARENATHHYFMALNADEVIDATQKGNISRFINHSCDPNAETQKWTVNGQLRIGFFVIKPLCEGEEITFNYQFESYGREQMKCYCGAANCRGVIGSDKSTPLKSRRRESKLKDKKKRKELFNDSFLEEEIEDMLQRGGLHQKDHVLELNRLMLRAESMEHRLSLLRILQETKEPACLRLFLEYHGLPLLWSWMVDAPSTANEFKMQTLNTLKILPINNKTMLKDSRVLSVVEKWAQEFSEAKKDGVQAKKTAEAENKKSEETKDNGKEQTEDAKKTESDSVSVKSTDTPASNTEKVNGPTTEKSFPHKKRRLMMQLQPMEASSSDGEPSESAKTEDTESQMEEESSEADGQIDAAVGEQPPVEVNQTFDYASDASRDEESTEAQDSSKPKMLGVVDLASELLSGWKNLKEVYKIPKIMVEERKKTERELDRQYEERSVSRRDSSYQGWDKSDRRRRSDESPEFRFGGKRRRHTEDSDDIRKHRRVLLPTPSLLSKQERRQQFEAQVKAQEEMQKEQQQQQQQQPDSTYQDFYASDASSATFAVADQSSISSYPSETLISVPFQEAVPYQDASGLAYHDASTGMLYDETMSVCYYQDPSATVSTFHAQEIPAQYVQPQQPYIDGQSVPADVLTYQVQTTQQPQSIVMNPAYSQQPVVVDGYGSQPVTSIVDPSLQYVDAEAGSFVSQPYVDPTQGSLVYGAHGLQYGQSMYYATAQGSMLLPQAVGQAMYQSPASVSSSPYVQLTPDQSTLQSLQIRQLKKQLEMARRQGPTDPRDPPPPPPSPPRSKAIRLPPNWKTAKDATGKVYYYHTVTRQTQWDPPALDSGTTEEDEGDEDDMDLGTPTNDDSKKQRRRTTTAAADTSSEEVAKKIKDQFRATIAKHIVTYLSPYRRADCEQGRINGADEFKHLARKLTHTILNKELKHCRHLEDLEVNENVKGKAKDYVNKYMSKFGPIYKPSANSP